MSKKSNLIYFILILSVSVLHAQKDGDILRKIRIDSFEKLLIYIKETEGRDSTGLDPARFQHLDDVHMYGISYLSDSLKVNGFLLTPKDTGPYPAIIYNRGGSIEWGSLTHWVSSIGLGELAELVRQGYVIAASQYRGNGGSEGQEEYGGADINDVMNLKKVLAQTPIADTSRIGMFGWSRGGMMSFITLKNYRENHGLKAVVIGGPGTNLVAGLADRPELEHNWSIIIPGFASDREKVLRARSAIYWVDKLPRDVPILMLHGTVDWHVKPEETLALAQEFIKNQIPHRLVMFEGAEHAIKEHHEEKMRQIISWFDRFLKNDEALPKTTGERW